MARITESLLVQRAEGLLVLMDDSTGAEIEFPVGATPNVVAAMQYLTPEFDQEHAEWKKRAKASDLAAIIRRVDGNHDLGAGALAEAIVGELET